MHGQPETPPRPDRSMSLLVDMMAGTLDDGYARAARTRQEHPRAEQAPAPARRRGIWVPLLVLLGLLTGTAAAQVRERAQEGAGARAELAATVAERTARTDALQQGVADARAALTRAREQALGAGEAGRRTADRVAALELAAGAVPVRGPGLVVVLDDAPEQVAPDGDPRTGPSTSGRVLDRDVQAAVNGLWAGGAEAVAVDGQRLTALTAVRSAGDLVLVDFRPVTAPYEVAAVGDPDALERGLDASGTRRLLESLRDTYGLRLSVRAEDELDLPAAGLPDLRVVEQR